MLNAAELSWPVGLLTRGEQLSYFDNTGSIGADYSVAVPAGEVWHILSVRCVLSTQPIVANRTVNVTFDFGLGIVSQFSSNNSVLHPAGTAYVYSFAPFNVQAGPSGASGSQVSASMPDVLIYNLGAPSGLRIRVENVQAGDNLSTVGIDYERWLA